MDYLGIAVVDDHQLFREGLARLIDSFEGMKTTIQAASGNELLRLLDSSKVRPQVVITDLQMADLDGYLTTREVKSRYPEMGVILLSMFDSPENIIELVSAGVDSYLHKNVSPEELQKCINRVHSGEKYFNRTVSKVLAKHVSNQVARSRDFSLSPEFKPMEIEVMQLICQEQTNRSISAELHVSERSIENIRKQLYKKTGTKSSTGLVLYAISHGLYSLYSDL